MRSLRLIVLIVYGLALVAWAAIIVWNDQRHLALPWAVLFGLWCASAVAVRLANR